MDDFDERLRLRLRALDAGVPAASANRRAGHGKLTPRRTLGPQVTGKLAFGLASGAEDRVARAKTEVIPSTWKSLRSMAGLALALCVALFVGIGYSTWRQNNGGFSGVTDTGSVQPTASPSSQSAPTFAGTSPAGRFSTVGSMTSPREGQTATLLSDGLVLIAGGENNGHPLSSAELYDPTVGSFTATGSMLVTRYDATATLLTDGIVLIAGGQGGGRSAELYDPKTGTFSPTGSMVEARLGQTATLLHDGRVLLAGGPSDATAELYDPKTGTFSPTGSMESGREFATATLLDDGRVLIAGGQVPGPTIFGSGLASAELYDPTTGEFSTTGSMAQPRVGACATLLLDGRVLISGGSSDSSSELYDPVTGSFSETGEMSESRVGATATLLADGQVLVAGGSSKSSADLYSPTTGTFSPAGSMEEIRDYATATLLADGRVLVAGGRGGTANSDLTTLSSAETYSPQG